MATDEFGERTEQPTERRRTQARDRGNVPRSMDLTAAGLLLGASVVFYFLILPLCQTLAGITTASLRNARPESIDIAAAVGIFRGVLESIAPQMLAVMLTMMATALLWNIVQVGFLVAPEVLQPQLARLNPLAGARRIFSAQGAMRLAGSLVKLAVAIGIAAWTIRAMLPGFVQLTGHEPRAFLFFVQASMVKLAFELACALVFLAVLDFLFQRWRHEQELRMTKQEVREELKEMEGDPVMRQRRREAHRKVAQARELQQARTADVIVTNPTEIAIALKYDPEKNPAPIVVAKGMGEIAAAIRRIAAENRIPIIERKEVAQLLYRTVKVGQAIPVELYQVFVEIMAYVYRITGRTPAGLS
jgi:flagellar biosynthesis protein FlhB